MLSASKNTKGDGDTTPSCSNQTFVFYYLKLAQSKYSSIQITLGVLFPFSQWLKNILYQMVIGIEAYVRKFGFIRISCLPPSTGRTIRVTKGELYQGRYEYPSLERLFLINPQNSDELVKIICYSL